MKLQRKEPKPVHEAFRCGADGQAPADKIYGLANLVESGRFADLPQDGRRNLVRNAANMAQRHDFLSAQAVQVFRRIAIGDRKDRDAITRWEALVFLPALCAKNHFLRATVADTLNKAKEQDPHPANRQLAGLLKRHLGGSSP